jgi:hypothetical protein
MGFVQLARSRFTSTRNTYHTQKYDKMLRLSFDYLILQAIKYEIISLLAENFISLNIR